MSYGANYPGLHRRAADYVDKVLRGTKPADIPVEQSAKFEFIVNMKTARRLVSPSRRRCCCGRIRS